MERSCDASRCWFSSYFAPINCEIAYFTDDHGERHRIFECAIGPPICRLHERGVMPPGSVHSNSRYFVPEFGISSVYRFANGESHELTATRFAHQLCAAEFAATTGPNASAVKPT
jgi:hypothetical protein